MGSQTIAGPLPVQAIGDGYPPAWRGWWSVGVLTVLYALSLLDRQVIALLVPHIREDLRINDFQVGLLQGIVFALFYVVFGLGFGWAVDRFSRRGVGFLGVTVWSLATGACGLARGFGHLMLARFGVGAGEAALNPAAYSLLSDTFPKKRLSLAISVFGAGAHVGGGLSLLLGGALIAALPAQGVTVPVLGDLGTWRVVMLAAGLPGLVLAPLIWTLVDPPRRDRLLGKSSSRDTLAFMKPRWRFFAGHFLGFGLMVAAANGHQAWTPVYLGRHFGIPIREIVSIVAPINIIAGISGSVLAGFVIDWLYTRGYKDAHLRYFIVAGVIQFASLLWAMTTSHLPVFILCAVLFQGACGFAGAAPAALQLVTPNNYRGQVSAAYLFVFNLIGTGLGPTMVGVYSTYVFRNDAHIGWAIALNGAIMLPLAILSFVWALKPMRHAIADAEAWSDAAEA
ncbi:MFS transporter [Phenylobacterium sp.]|uniref:MFS transporter n=1 Tax=Phenylobacterium sp. TaxID=1871053 RepID=UPI002F3E6B2B